jgi:DNA repair protein RecN (Recombination protein N)
LAERVSKELPQIALEQARFFVSIETASARAAADMGGEAEAGGEKEAAYWTQSGCDRVEFLLAANVGEEARPLGRIASGGELSRLMLTLRTVAQRQAPPQGVDAQGATLVFDEIDVGIGGRVAEAVGRRLKALAATQQILCVTHQPQIARFADHHYVVEKRVAGGRTASFVRQVVGEERVSELARMIGGTEDVSTTRETARWLIESAAGGVKLRAPEAQAGKKPVVGGGRAVRRKRKDSRLP